MYWKLESKPSNCGKEVHSHPSKHANLALRNTSRWKSPHSMFGHTLDFQRMQKKLGWIQARCTIIHHRKVLPLFRSAVPKTLCRITDITPTMVTQIFRLTSSGAYPISRDFPKRKGFNLGWICAGAFGEPQAAV